MNPHAPSLSALATNIDELIARVGVIARDLDREPTERAAAMLYETERSLRAAARRLDSTRRELGA